MAKALIWILTFVGLAPSILVAIGGIFVLYNAQSTDAVNLGDKSRGIGTSVFIHDSYFAFGTWNVDFYPRCWSIATLLTGIALVVSSLYSLLHRPES